MSKKLWFHSAVSVLVSLSLLLAVVNWHTELKGSLTTPSGRFLHDAIDDDVTRDETCRKYLLNFLNGTTDSQDQCHGMYNAWSAADCQDDSRLPNFMKEDDNKKNDSATDDVLIDDFYENWECCVSIADYYGRYCQEPQLDAFRLMGIVAVLVVCGLCQSLLRTAGLHWIPNAGACILVGSVVGGILRIVNHNVVQNNMTFNNDLFLKILLPPIVFQAAISIDKRAFRRDLFPILTLAIFGTVFSAIAIGYITFVLSQWTHTALPLLDSLLFGALMSSIDPVATLSILSGVGVNQGDTLFTLIFGESLLNDGVSIVLFDSLVRHVGDKAVVNQATVADTLSHFLVVATGSIVVGVVCGALCTFYFWALKGKHTAVSEVAIFFCWALIPYYIADGFEWSGIISIMVMGFMLDYYVIGGFVNDTAEWEEFIDLRCHEDDAHPVQPFFRRAMLACCHAFTGKGHMLTRARGHVEFVAEVISSLMETAIFAYLGLFLFNDKDWSFLLTTTGIVSCTVSRAVMVVLLCLLINFCVYIDLESRLTSLWRLCCGRSSWNDDDSLGGYDRVYLDAKTQLILFSAGVRGAVSYALVQNIPVYDAVTKHGSHFKGELKAMTSATIVAILFAFGAMTYFTVQRDLRDNASIDPHTHTLHQRLMSIGLASEDGEADEDDVLADPNGLSLEIESRPYLRDSRASE